MFMALKNSIDFLNAFRMVSQADTYFGGRDALKAENSNVKNPEKISKGNIFSLFFI